MNRRSFLLRSTLAAVALATRAFTRESDEEGRRLPRLPEAAKPVLPPEPWDEEAEELARWRRAPRLPVLDSTAPELSPLLLAIRTGGAVRFRYFGGSGFGAVREITPGLLFSVAGFPGTYVSGYCHVRRAERTFLVERMRDVEIAAG
jgi:predicted DNA-binding transcriptional regulator YafY